MSDLRDIVEGGLTILLAAAIIVGFVFVGSYLTDRPICNARTQGIGMEHRWGFWSGCQVEVEPGIWIPLDNWYYRDGE